MIPTVANLKRWLASAQHALATLPKWQLQQMTAAGGCQSEGVCFVSGEEIVEAGDVDEEFTLMSAVKPFILLRLLELHGPLSVDGWVGREASQRPYYSVEQLLMDGGRPRNAMINSGAMLLASKLPGASPAEQCADFCSWLGQLAPRAAFALDETCLAEVLAPGADPTNMALAKELERVGALPDAAVAYDAYFRLCCLTASVGAVAHLAATLALRADEAAQSVRAAMQVAGLYEASADWWERTRLPAKTGVSGMMLGVLPGLGGIAACSPWLDEAGNPILPQLVLMQFSAHNSAGAGEGIS